MKKVFLSVFVSVLLGTILSCSTTPVTFKVEPTSHNFGAVNIGTTATFDFILTNNKSVDMTLTTIDFQTGEFSEITGAQGQIIVAKNTLVITVRFAPALPGGTKSDTMSIEWTDINGKTGKKDISLKGDAVPSPEINAPTTYDFGTVGIGQTATHNFNISNTGTADLILSLFNFNGNAALFSITAGGVTPVTIIPGATHTVTVQFAPAAVGDFPTILEITHNAVNALTPHQINIAAAGGGGRIEINQSNPWDIGEAAIGMGGITDEVEISNTGSINLNISSISLFTGNVFSIESIEDSAGNPIAAPFDIAPSDFVVVTISFEPTAIQQYNDTLSIANDGSYAASPLDLVIDGAGRALTTQTFNYTGAVQNWNVPAGLQKIKAECWGAEGGPEEISALLGGKGGKATATVPVTPGVTVGVYVGEKGIAIMAGPGGWNGGGATNSTWATFYPGTGGGGSDIRIGGTSWADRKVVGGGGGGAGHRNYGATGGNGGGLTGQDGNQNYSNPNAKGGSQTAGGAGGDWNGRLAGAGTFGEGGTGLGNSSGGGAGGGGWYGGGGGVVDGGAGGSSYYDATGNTDKSTQPGVRTGNGQVIISY